MNVYRIYYTVNEEPYDEYVLACTTQKAVDHIREANSGENVVKNWK